MIRPDSWNLPLFLHGLSAMVFLGTLATVAVALLTPLRREPSAALPRLAFRSLVVAGLPAYVAMLASGEWITHKEGLGGENDPIWFVIGVVVGDFTGLLLVVSILLTGIATWKSKPGLGRAAGAVVTVALLALLVAVWAMTAKSP
jgi:type IV secretory pathway VirB2 component (pilin)